MRVKPPQHKAKEIIMPKSKAAGLTRRQMLKVGGAATFAGYAFGVEKALGQAIKTDTQGIVAGDAQVPIGSYNMPVYEARPANVTNAPIVLVISESGACTSG
jgi:carboxymethylenebutenolidase